MSNLQHERITTLATELRLLAVPDLYGPIAQTAATRKDASYADFLEDILRAERDARHVRTREMMTRMAGFPALKTLEAYDFAFATGVMRISSCSARAAPGKRTWPSRSEFSRRRRAGRCASRPRPI